MDEALCESYLINYQSIINEIKKRNAHKIFFQAPNGLKKLYICIEKHVKKKLADLEIYYSASPSFGACDIPLEEIELIDPDLIIHIGHNEYPLISKKIKYEILYVPAYYKWEPAQDIISKVINELEKYGVKRVGLVASIQHVHSLEKISEMLRKHEYIVSIAKPAYDAMLSGQILGCEYSAALKLHGKVNAYIVLAGGYFHALGLGMLVDEPVIIIDPYRQQVIDPSGDIKRLKAKRFYVISMLRNKPINTVGIVIGSRPGQFRPVLVNYIRKLLEEHNIKYYLITSTYINKEQLISIDNALNLDLYVITSCPRLPIDDLSDFYKPIITPGELIMILKNIVEKYVYPW